MCNTWCYKWSEASGDIVRIDKDRIKWSINISGKKKTETLAFFENIKIKPHGALKKILTMFHLSKYRKGLFHIKDM